jgi:hypothetical protein
MFRSLINIFIPYSGNNHRSKLLQPQPIAVLLGVFLTFQVSLRVFAGVAGGVLGYASDITVQQILNQTNQVRQEQGLSPLALNSVLSQAAQAKAADMFTFDYWSHTNPENQHDPWHFINQAGYQYRFAGENLARDFATTPPMIQAWLDSTTHRDNIYSEKYSEMGLAVVNGHLNGFETTLVVQMFGEPKEATARSQIPGVMAMEIGDASSDQPPVIVESSEVDKSHSLLSPLSINKAVSLTILGLLVVALLIDTLYIILKRPTRAVGKNWLHLAFIAILIIIIYQLTQGVIK